MQQYDDLSLPRLLQVRLHMSLKDLKHYYLRFKQNNYCTEQFKKSFISYVDINVLRELKL